MNNMEQNNFENNPQGPHGQPNPQQQANAQEQPNQHGPGPHQQSGPHTGPQYGQSQQGPYQQGPYQHGPYQQGQSQQQVNQFEFDLKNAWSAYQARQQEIEQLAQKPEIPHEVIESLKTSSKKQLDDSLYQIYTKYQSSKTQQQSFKKERKSFGERFQDYDNMYRFYRVEEGRTIAGVCKGLSEYFNIDVAIIRLVVLVCSIIGLGVPPLLIVPLAYVVAAIILPMKSEVEAQRKNGYAT